jgi:hypothetical protein
VDGTGCCELSGCDTATGSAPVSAAAGSGNCSVNADGPPEGPKSALRLATCNSVVLPSSVAPTCQDLAGEPSMATIAKPPLVSPVEGGAITPTSWKRSLSGC